MNYEKNFLMIISKIFGNLSSWKEAYEQVKKVISEEVDVLDIDNANKEERKADARVELAAKIINDIRWIYRNDRDGFATPSSIKNVREAVADYIYRGNAYGVGITPEDLDAADIILKVRHAELLG